MAKDINIHIKTKGASQTKQQLNGVGKSAKQVGDDTQAMGKKGQEGSNRFVNGLKRIAGPVGFLAVAAAIAKTAKKVAEFFDVIARRSDEAAEQLYAVRSQFEGLFEAMNAFDEKARKAVTVNAAELLKKTRVPASTGVPVIEAYARQFSSQVESGAITQEQYDQGLEGMLGYAARHGGSATPDLIALMAGWGMTTPESQGVFRRQVATAAANSGLTDSDVISSLGRGMPTIKAMGWTPEQALETVAVLARGETGRKKMSLPATTLQGLMLPQETGLEDYGISPELAGNPQQLLNTLASRRQTMSQSDFTQMLTSIYGVEASTGVYKLLTAQRTGVRNALGFAAGDEGLAAEQQEEMTSRETKERERAATEAEKTLIDLIARDREWYESEVRSIGESYQKRLQIEEPKRQWIKEFMEPGNEGEKTAAARRRWQDSLSEQERQKILDEYDNPFQIDAPFNEAWKDMSPRERHTALTTESHPSAPPVFIQNQNIYTPRVGSDGRGPRVGRDLRN